MSLPRNGGTKQPPTTGGVAERRLGMDGSQNGHDPGKLLAKSVQVRCITLSLSLDTELLTFPLADTEQRGVTRATHGRTLSRARRNQRRPLLLPRSPSAVGRSAARHLGARLHPHPLATSQRCFRIVYACPRRGGCQNMRLSRWRRHYQRHSVSITTSFYTRMLPLLNCTQVPPALLPLPKVHAIAGT